MKEFKDMRTLVVDPTGHSKALLRKLLVNLCVQKAEGVSNTDEALLALRQELYTIVFCDELAGPLHPFDFLRALRRDISSRDVTIPVVMVSSGLEISKVAAARDAGMNDVIVKPVSIDTIERKLRSLVLAPKQFITTRAFVGPDRRRSGDRRQFGERTDTAERRGQTSDAGVFQVGPRLCPENPKV